LADSDRTIRDRIPVTSISRNLLDIAPSLSHERLMRIIEELDDRLKPDWSAAWEICLRVSGHRGSGRLRRALAAVTDFRPVVRSKMERLFNALCRKAGLPASSINVVVPGHEGRRVLGGRRPHVELDGYANHRTRLQMERDHARDVELQLAGFRVFRLTWRMLTAGADETIRKLRRALQEPGVGAIDLA
jgi:hypothetical protein